MDETCVENCLRQKVFYLVSIHLESQELKFSCPTHLSKLFSFYFTYSKLLASFSKLQLRIYVRFIIKAIYKIKLISKTLSI